MKFITKIILLSISLISIGSCAPGVIPPHHPRPAAHPHPVPHVRDRAVVHPVWSKYHVWSSFTSRKLSAPTG